MKNVRTRVSPWLRKNRSKGACQMLHVTVQTSSRDITISGVLMAQILAHVKNVSVPPLLDHVKILWICEKKFVFISWSNTFFVQFDL